MSTSQLFLSKPRADFVVQVTNQREGKKPCRERAFRLEPWLLSCGGRWLYPVWSLNSSPLFITKRLPSSFLQRAREGSGPLSQGELRRGQSTPTLSAARGTLHPGRGMTIWAPPPPQQVFDAFSFPIILLLWLRGPC